MLSSHGKSGSPSFIRIERVPTEETDSNEYILLIVLSSKRCAEWWRQTSSVRACRRVVQLTADHILSFTQSDSLAASGHLFEALCKYISVIWEGRLQWTSFRVTLKWERFLNIFVLNLKTNKHYDFVKVIYEKNVVLKLICNDATKIGTNILEGSTLFLTV